MNPDLTVFVSNISLKANSKSVSDFFSFCGKIVNLVLRNDQTGSSQESLVMFETDSAAKTALLLTNALIVDKVITVVPYNPAVHGVLQEPLDEDANNNQIYRSVEPQEITNREYTVPDDQRTKTSTLASLVAAGYSLGQDALIKAKTVDEEHMISLKLKVGAEAVKAKANEINNKLHISEGAAAIKSTVVEKAKVVDERFQISGMFKSATDFLSQQGSALVAKVNDENAIYTPFVSNVKAVGNSIKEQVQQTVNETEKAIDEKKKEREQQQNPQPQSPPIQSTQQEEFSNQL
ncbi:RNA-binding region RNP-1 domain-containing protein [Tieghemostelium lacteum]|uniref:RNA-binding region RNP-1 domain-containing protein n=1 Tax=Tieghemostelium lacteum TaxID=361077 RepID=A0A151ZK98_TIELA|nr:RNA-binding region RNP-1 domain-containing protein [Tieghemostelium lacteum]|eukprot:KYQ94310.1 RNA-binding region RNP-1 domain-containing protein [Tieghemostelium lacteum]